MWTCSGPAESPRPSLNKKRRGGWDALPQPARSLIRFLEYLSLVTKITHEGACTNLQPSLGFTPDSIHMGNLFHHAGDTLWQGDKKITMTFQGYTTCQGWPGSHHDLIAPGSRQGLKVISGSNTFLREGRVGLGVHKWITWSDHYS